MKMVRIKKRIAAMMMVSALSVWFALSNVAYAQTLTIEGRNIYTSLTVSSSSATVTISYTEGPGQVWASVTGEAINKLIPTMGTSVQGGRNSNPTPGGVSSSVDAPNGWKFTGASSWCDYQLDINGTIYKNGIYDHKNV
ncbi:MAG: hypothetical protein NC123_00410 [Butyrivibrio sp.]|nr:hypothetical protein [Acetatifactor muris]MCM1557997.1 hypothetical protein [Butyrivibrio sp.]